MAEETVGTLRGVGCSLPLVVPLGINLIKKEGGWFQSRFAGHGSEND